MTGRRVVLRPARSVWLEGWESLQEYVTVSANVTLKNYVMRRIPSFGGAVVLLASCKPRLWLAISSPYFPTGRGGCGAIRAGGRDYRHYVFGELFRGTAGVRGALVCPADDV